MLPDYSGQNLRGRSFKGQNLTGANFSGADIRGANFTNAILKDGDFRGAKAGLQRHWVIGLVIVSWVLSALSGFFSIVVGALIAYIFDTKNIENVITGMVSLIVVTVFFIVTIRKGLIASLATVVIALAGTGALAGALAVAGAFAVVVAGAFAGAGALAGALAVAGYGVLAFAVAFAVVVAGAFARDRALAGAVGFVLFSAYIGWRSLTGDEKYASVRSVAIAFAATGGTSFYNADLTDADFTGATLKNTDFRNANITHTRFYETKKLDFARVGDTILAKRNILNLLVTGNGRGKSYFAANLKGANLIGADFKEANLKHADISEATFQGACLEWANLNRTQAIETDFTSAQMTGACVEAWNIESTTKLNNVDCRFIYLLENPKPGTDDRERRPSSGEFQPGEFTKLFEEVLNTVDLIFRDGIDWKAFVAAFKKVQVENEDTELAIQSIENKGDGVVVVKVAVPIDADKEKIHSDFTQNGVSVPVGD